mmetsp:Transcript_60400/g.191850  ORF Transcript_60400/g.191850 Transcript_60400/m.191850 type:complete len:497 (+) Transcript_60400:140-1630(+)
MVLLLLLVLLVVGIVPAVVDGLLAGVREDLVRLGDVLELLVRLLLVHPLVAGLVGVVLERHALVGLLDVPLGGLAGDLEDLIVVLAAGDLEGALGALQEGVRLPGLVVHVLGLARLVHRRLPVLHDQVDLRLLRDGVVVVGVDDEDVVAALQGLLALAEAGLRLAQPQPVLLVDLPRLLIDAERVLVLADGVPELAHAHVLLGVLAALVEVLDLAVLHLGLLVLRVKAQCLAEVAQRELHVVEVEVGAPAEEERAHVAWFHLEDLARLAHALIPVLARKLLLREKDARPDAVRRDLEDHTDLELHLLEVVPLCHHPGIGKRLLAPPARVDLVLRGLVPSWLHLQHLNEVRLSAVEVAHRAVDLAAVEIALDERRVDLHRLVEVLERLVALAELQVGSSALGVREGGEGVTRDGSGVVLDPRGELPLGDGRIAQPELPRDINGGRLLPLRRTTRRAGRPFRRGRVRRRLGPSGDRKEREDEPVLPHQAPPGHASNPA